MTGQTETRRIMTASELKKFKKALLDRQAELQGLMRNRDAAVIETSADALDQIQHSVERELALGTLARESAGLRETRAALRRMATDAYGICVDCEEELSPKRLAAVPWAARCVACQERQDREGAAGDESDGLLAEAA
jgi:DnaK suppressor protein